MRRIDLSIAQRMVLGFGSILALFLILAAIAGYENLRIDLQQDRLANEIAPRARAADELERAYLQQIIAARSYALTSDERYLDEYRQAAQEAGAALTLLGQMPRDPDSVDLFAQLAPLADQYKSAADRFFGLAHGGASAEALADAESRMRAIRSQLIAGTRAHADLQTEKLAAAIEEIEHSQSAEARAFLVLALLMLAAGVITAIFTTRAVHDPARRLVQASRALGSGDFQAAIAPEATSVDRSQADGGPLRDELRELAAAFGRMAAALQQREQQLAAQNEELQAQGEEICAQNEELQAQNEEIQAQSEELQAQSEQLRFQTSLLEAQSEASYDGILVVAPDGKILDFNRRFIELWGIAEAVIAARSDSAALQFVQDQVADPREFLARVAYLYEHPEEESQEQIRLRDGRTLKRYSAPVKGADGRHYGRVWYFRDVSQRKRAEDARRFLNEASALLATSLDYETTLQSVARLVVLNLANHCVIRTLEQDGSIRQAIVASRDPSREERLRALGRPPLDPDGPHPVARVVRTGQSEYVPELSELLQEAIPSEADLLSELRELGCCSAMVAPLQARGRTLGAISFVADKPGRFGPSDLALAENLARRCAVAMDNARLYQESQAAISLRDEFLSVAAHELKTPLTSLRGFAQLLVRQLDREGALDPERLRHALLAVDRQSGKLARLISQLLDASRIEAGKLALDRQIADVVSLVQDVAEGTRARTSHHSVAVLAPAQVLANVDALRFEQVVTNLLDNAVKYSPDGGEITVEVACPDDESVNIVVTDHGLGIPLEHRSRVFDRFYQAHASEHRGGMGLGLFISREIVALHGGDISAEFPPQGGTRFIISLPTGLTVTSPLPETEGVA